MRHVVEETLPGIINFYGCAYNDRNIIRDRIGLELLIIFKDITDRIIVVDDQYFFLRQLPDELTSSSTFGEFLVNTREM
jgi:hypothetical protein